MRKKGQKLEMFANFGQTFGTDTTLIGLYNSIF